jgi:hypothetical protein
VVGSQATAGTPCVEQSPVNLRSGEVESERGHTVEASIGFIGAGAGVGTGLAWCGAVRAGRALGRALARQNASNTWAFVSASVKCL